MSLLVCRNCTARYAPDLGACPQCSSTRARLEGAGGSVLPMVMVACRNGACPVVGVSHRVMLRAAAPGVLEQPGYVCGRCLHQMSQQVDTEQEQEAEDVAKVTVHGGPSNANEEPVEVPPDQPGQSVQDDGEQTAGETDGGEYPVTDDPGYDAWTVDQLKAELADRDLPTTGKKADLQQRLVDDDQQRNQPAPEGG